MSDPHTFASAILMSIAPGSGSGTGYSRISKGLPVPWNTASRAVSAMSRSLPHLVMDAAPRMLGRGGEQSQRPVCAGCLASGRARDPAILPTVYDDALPLSGLLVVDLTRVLAGPYCTRLLADLGPRVIKIERPGAGDEMRRGPIQLEEGRDDQSTYFVRCNAGKARVGLDLGHAAA